MLTKSHFKLELTTQSVRLNGVPKASSMLIESFRGWPRFSGLIRIASCLAWYQRIPCSEASQSVSRAEDV